MTSGSRGTRSILSGHPVERPSPGRRPVGQARRADEPVPPALAWYSLGVLVAAVLLSFVDRQIIALQMEAIAGSLHLKDSDVGLIQGLGLATFAIVATFPLGWLADHFDRRIVLGGSALVWTAGTVGCGLSHTMPGLFVAVLAVGAGEAGLPSLAYSAIPDLFRGPARTTANQVFYIAMILSSAAGIAFGGGLSAALDHVRAELPAQLATTEPWRIVFYALALPAPLLLGLIAFTRLGRPTPGPDARAPGTGGTSLLQHLRAHGGAVAMILAALCAYGFPFGAILAWTPLALSRRFHVGPGTSGLGLGVALAAGCVLGATLAGMLVRRYYSRLGPRVLFRVAAWTLLASLPVAAALPFAASALQIFLLVGLLVLSGTLIGSLLPQILQDMAPAMLRGQTTAVYYILSAVSTGVGITLVGLLSAALPPSRSPLFMATSALLLCSWLVGAVLMRLAERPFARLSDLFRSEAHRS